MMFSKHILAAMVWSIPAVRGVTVPLQGECDRSCDNPDCCPTLSGFIVTRVNKRRCETFDTFCGDNPDCCTSMGRIETGGDYCESVCYYGNPVPAPPAFEEAISTNPAFKELYQGYESRGDQNSMNVVMEYLTEPGVAQQRYGDSYSGLIKELEFALAPTTTKSAKKDHKGKIGKKSKKKSKSLSPGLAPVMLSPESPRNGYYGSKGGGFYYGGVGVAKRGYYGSKGGGFYYGGVGVAKKGYYGSKGRGYYGDVGTYDDSKGSKGYYGTATGISKGTPFTSPSTFPSVAPSVGPSASPTDECFEYKVWVKTDNHPLDTSWKFVTSGADNVEVVHAERKSYSDKEKNTVFVDTVCLTKGTTFEFQVFDSYGDGILHPGWYQVETPRNKVVIASPDEWEGFWNKTHALTVPENEDDFGCQGYTLKVLTDQYPLETSWKFLTSSSVNGEELVFAESKAETYSQNATLYTETVCLSADSRTFDFVEFQIFDSYGDGLCCGHGVGWYKVEGPDGGVILDSAEEDAPFLTNKTYSLSTGLAHTDQPTGQPTTFPTVSREPTDQPSDQPTTFPTVSREPTVQPTPELTMPTEEPITVQPSTWGPSDATGNPTFGPTVQLVFPTFP